MVPLQWLHYWRMAWMAGVLPGQKTEDSAREIIAVTPLCAELRTSRNSFLSEGLTILSLKVITPLTIDRCS